MSMTDFRVTGGPYPRLVGLIVEADENKVRNAGLDAAVEIFVSLDETVSRVQIKKHYLDSVEDEDTNQYVHGVPIGNGLKVPYPIRHHRGWRNGRAASKNRKKR